MQFVLGPRFPSGLHGWQHIRLGETLHLAAHPDLNIERADNDSVSLTLIGYLLDPERPNFTNADILGSLVSSIEQGENLIDLIDSFGGRCRILCRRFPR